MTIDKQKLKALADRVLNERRFCVDEHHRELAEGVHALMAEVVFLLESRAEARADRNNIGDRYDDAIIECDQLKAENEALRDGANFRAIQSLRADCDALSKDAERYRGVRRVANRQGFTDEQFDQQTDSRVANFDAAMAKEASR